MPTILVVEDNLLNKELVYIFLKDNYIIDHAKDGYTAIKMAHSKFYEAILMDINLKSDMDGIQAADLIKKIPGYEQVPIAAVTGYTSEQDLQKIYKSECSHYLGKPFNRVGLIQLVDEMLNNNAFNNNINEIH
jgi:CheY-like chemotaxis protein